METTLSNDHSNSRTPQHMLMFLPNCPEERSQQVQSRFFTIRYYRFLVYLGRWSVTNSNHPDALKTEMGQNLKLFIWAPLRSHKVVVWMKRNSPLGTCPPWFWRMSKHFRSSAGFTPYDQWSWEGWDLHSGLLGCQLTSIRGVGSIFIEKVAGW